MLPVRETTPFANGIVLFANGIVIIPVRERTLPFANGISTKFPIVNGSLSRLGVYQPDSHSRTGVLHRRMSTLREWGNIKNPVRERDIYCSRTVILK